MPPNIQNHPFFKSPLKQPDGTYAIGAVVPELPPGAAQASINGTVAYQFNGIYYEPTFVNGVTQYETFVS
jgi:hypothetical protein